MIECRIRQAALRRGLKNKYQFAKAVAESEGREMEMRDVMLAGRLWEAGAQPTLGSIDKALQAMPGCDLSEVLVRKAQKSEPAKKNGHRKSAKRGI